MNSGIEGLHVLSIIDMIGRHIEMGVAVLEWEQS